MRTKRPPSEQKKRDCDSFTGIVSFQEEKKTTSTRPPPTYPKEERQNGWKTLRIIISEPPASASMSASPGNGMCLKQNGQNVCFSNSYSGLHVFLDL